MPSSSAVILVVLYVLIRYAMRFAKQVQKAVPPAKHQPSPTMPQASKPSEPRPIPGQQVFPTLDTYAPEPVRSFEPQESELPEGDAFDHQFSYSGAVRASQPVPRAVPRKEAHDEEPLIGFAGALLRSNQQVTAMVLHEVLGPPVSRRNANGRAISSSIHQRL